VTQEADQLASNELQSFEKHSGKTTDTQFTANIQVLLQILVAIVAKLEVL
jgi:hypothetical protein